jgi:hypothetical protein
MLEHDDIDDEDFTYDGAYAISVEEAVTLPLAELRKRVLRIVTDAIRLAKPGQLPDDFPFEPDALSRDELLAAVAKHGYWFAPIPITDWNFVEIRGDGRPCDPEEAGIEAMDDRGMFGPGSGDVPRRDDTKNRLN